MHVFDMTNVVARTTGNAILQFFRPRSGEVRLAGNFIDRQPNRIFYLTVDAKAFRFSQAGRTVKIPLTLHGKFGCIRRLNTSGGADMIICYVLLILDSYEAMVVRIDV